MRWTAQQGATKNYTKWNKLLKTVSQKQVQIIKVGNLGMCVNITSTLALILKESGKNHVLSHSSLSKVTTPGNSEALATIWDN